MINLRYHIVSLTAVFLAIGIGLAFGSTFLDQATVDNLRGQLHNLQGGLETRDQRISALEDELNGTRDQEEALDAQGAALLEGMADGAPVLLVAGTGADEGDVSGLIESLTAAGANTAGTWWITDRFVLDDDSEIDDLAEATGVNSTRAETLRREAISVLSRAIADQQAIDPDPEGGPDDGGSDDGATQGNDNPEANEGGEIVEGADDGEVAGAFEDEDVVAELFARGFLRFEPIPGGPEQPFIPEAARLVVVGGSESVHDDLVLVPLTGALRDGPDNSALLVATSAAPDEEGVISPLVTSIREDEQLRELVSTVDTAEHFTGRAAIVMTVAKLGSGSVGHYGMGEGSARLLPEQPAP